MDGRRFNISLETQLGQMEFLFLQNADFESDKFCPNFFFRSNFEHSDRSVTDVTEKFDFFSVGRRLRKKNFFCTSFQNVIDNKPNFIME